ncbi:arachidonate 5-lipoxygenase-activating protein isoform X2 [Brienomyrus brachyistius]|uniref:arachidonate 5-lipoxygenase-activating protein isoform X2 n=1 Tax=Brienomyrus brachyistius TaxID=42636 RepID=UPI0020B1F44D|nr:arachidonate 5-lipoxygenase-activating protein isoform X2 [Brienomyrus brachyistius]
MFFQQEAHQCMLKDKIISSCNECDGARRRPAVRCSACRAAIAQCTIMEVMEDVFMLVIVTLLSVLQNASFANKVEKECKTANAKTAAYERVYCANRNCMDTYPTFIAVMWCAGICLSQAPAAFAGIMYLFVRQKYFVGYMGQTPQSTPGYLFGKRIIAFLFAMSVVGIISFLLAEYFAVDYKEYIRTLTNAASALLLIP